MDFCFVDQIFYPSEFTTDTWESYIKRHKALADSLGIIFTQTHGHIHDFCMDRRLEQWELVKRCVDGAAILGAPLMVMHPSTYIVDGRRHPDTEKINQEYFGKLAEYGKSRGIEIEVENMWGETKEGVKRYCIQPEELLDLLKAIGSDNLGICWDTEHGAIENLDQDKAIAKVGPYLRATHISDQTDRGNVHVLPYTGNTDWDMILKALAKADYKGAFTYEIQHYLLAMPEKLVPDAISLSYKVGEEMADQLEHYKKILA